MCMTRSTSHGSTSDLALPFSYLFRKLSTGLEALTIPAENHKENEKNYCDASHPSDDPSDDLLLGGTQCTSATTS